MKLPNYKRQDNVCNQCWKATHKSHSNNKGKQYWTKIFGLLKKPIREVKKKMLCPKHQIWMHYSKLKFAFWCNDCGKHYPALDGRATERVILNAPDL